MKRLIIHIADTPILNCVIDDAELTMRQIFARIITMLELAGKDSIKENTIEIQMSNENSIK